jgi:hypothetical protein
MEGAAVNALAHQDSLVKFEFNNLAKFEADLNKAVAERDAARITQAQKAIVEQRRRTGEAEARLREYREEVANNARKVEQRLLAGKDFNAITRINGEVKERLNRRNEKNQEQYDAATREAERLAAEENRNRGQAGLAPGEEPPKSVGRALGPVTREQSAAPGQFRTGTEESAAGAGRTGLSQRLSEARGEKQRDVPLSKSEMESANELAANLRKETAEANAEAERLRNMTPAQKKKAAKEFAQVQKETEKRLRSSRVASAIDEMDEEDRFNTRYNEAAHTELSDNIKDALRDGRLLDALKELAENGSTALIRKNAALLVKYNLRTKVGVWAGLDKPASYFPERNGIVFHPEGMSEENLVHEANHAASARLIDEPIQNLTPSQREAREGLQKLFDQVKDNPELKGEYGIEDLHEFSSEVQSNAAFRAALDKINVAPKVSALKQFGRWLMQLVGLSKPETTSDLASRHI